MQQILSRLYQEDPREFKKQTLQILGNHRKKRKIETEETKSKPMITLHSLNRMLEIEKLKPGLLCSILMVKDGKLSTLAAPNLPKFYSEGVNGLNIGVGVGSCGTAAATGKTVIVSDISTHPYWAPFKEFTLQAGLQACWSIPVFSRDKQVIATVACYFQKPTHPDDMDIQILTATSCMSGIAIERHRALDEIRSMNNTLDQKIKERTKELEVAKEEAEDSSRTKTQFLNIVSHEIRTPLSGVIATCHLLQDFVSNNNIPQKEQIMEYLHIIQSSGNALMAVMNDILDFRKIQAGKMHLESVPFELPTLIGEAHDSVLHLLKEKKLQFVKTYESPFKFFIGDPTRIRQILINLVGNAAKFTKEGTIEIRVSVSDTRPKALVEINVLDSGIGIPAAKLNEIFDSFSQVCSSSYNREYGGTGLGLSICSHLAKLMDGSLSVKSQEGVGSTFTLVVPLERQESLEQETERKMTRNYNKKVLICEDNRINQKVAEKYLQKVSVKCDFAFNGAEALEKIQHIKYDLILMDLCMPGMDGFETTERIRSSDSPNSIVGIVAVTASAMPDVKEKCQRAGMNGCILKPFSQTDLIEELDKWL